MEHFLECTLVSELYPSLPSGTDTEIDARLTSENKQRKSRKIIKARRLIKKDAEATNETKKTPKAVHTKPIDSVNSAKGPNAAATVAFREIQKSNYFKRFSKSLVRFSDCSFLENERLCGINHSDTKAPQKVTRLSDKCTPQKRKLPAKRNSVAKKRRTLESVDVNPSPKQEINIKTISTPVKTPHPKKPTFKSKPMPNFARIFQEKFDNTENIIEYKERKADRAAKLLSGAKPLRIEPMIFSERMPPPKMKKELTFTTEDSPHIANLPRLKNELICTPHPRSRKIPEKILNQHNPANINDVKKYAFTNNILSRLRSASKPKPISCSTPSITSTAHIFNANQDLVANAHQNNANRFGFRRDNKTTTLRNALVQNVTKSTPNINNIFESKSFANEPKKLLYPGKKDADRTKPRTDSAVKVNPNVKRLNVIKDADRPAVPQPSNNKEIRSKKEYLIKEVQTRTRPGREFMGARRHEIKGVRLNRRFELLMQMRGGNDN